MNIPSSLFVFFLIIVFVFAFFVIGTEYTIPFFVRANFDDICNNYLAIIEKNSKLDTAHRNQLTYELSQIGITVTNLAAPSSTSWGNKATLIVEGTYAFKTTNFLNFTKNVVSKPIKYKNSTIVLSLE